MRTNAEETRESKKEDFDGDWQKIPVQIEIDSSFVLVNALVERPVAGPLMVIAP